MHLYMQRMYFFGAIWDKSALYLVRIYSVIILKNDVRSAPSERAIWDAFSEQHQGFKTQTKKSTIFNARLQLF